MRLALPRSVYRVGFIRAFFAAVVWRLLERDSPHEWEQFPDTTGQGKSGPDYKYGKVTDLHPDVLVMTETTESPYVCCGYCTAGMACRVARDGLSKKMQETAHPIRSQGGRPHNNGNNAGELRTGAERAHNVKLKAIAISEIKDRLRQGYAVTVGLDYAALPGYLKVQGGDFGHACMLYGLQDRDDDDRVGFFDPLYPQDTRGAWARWTDVKAALWSDGNHSTTTVLRNPPPEPPEPEPEPEPEPVPQPPARVNPYDTGYAKGLVDGSNKTYDIVFASWLNGAVGPTRWGEVKWDVAAWVAFPIPIWWVEASREPATFNNSMWTGARWS